MVPYAQKLPQNRDILQLKPAGFGPFLAAVIVVGFSNGRTELRHWLAKIFRLRIPVILLHGASTIIDNFVSMPMVVLVGFGTSTVLRGLVYWAIAIVIVILTKGRLGVDSNNTQLGY